MSAELKDALADLVEKLKPAPSRRGEVIAFATLALAAVVWFGQDRQDKGATQRSLENNATLLAQRNREIDALERRISTIELRRNCQP